jgi:SsrA-binding protein
MKIINKRAHFDYTISEHIEAGIKLSGPEVKAVRLGHADMTSSHVRIAGNEAYLLNAKIFPYEYARPENYEENRTRKLLLHKSQIIAIKSKVDGGNLTIVPVSMYTTKGYIKLDLGLGKGKKQFEKKEKMKKADIDRDLERDLSER